MSITIPRPTQTTEYAYVEIETIGNDSSQPTEKIVCHVNIKRDEDGRYVAECTDIQGAVSDGATEDEAIKNIQEAIIAILQAKGENKEFYLIIDSI